MHLDSSPRPTALLLELRAGQLPASGTPEEDATIVTATLLPWPLFLCNGKDTVRHRFTTHTGEAAYSFPSYSFSAWEGERKPGCDDQVRPVRPRCGASAPRTVAIELDQPLVADPEVMRDLVEHDVPDLAA